MAGAEKAKPQIFLVHGMGNFAPSWGNTVIKQITDLIDKYPILKQGNYKNNFGFKEILYNDEFESWRAQWKQDAQAATIAMKAVGLDGGIADALLKVASTTTPDQFLQTHVLDVILYRYFPQIRESVHRSIELQITKHLNSFESVPPYSIIAHSLGTAVIYKTLRAMITDSPPLANNFRPAYLFAISNTANALWGDDEGDLYDQDLGPSTMDHIGMCSKFGNFHHALDPFCNVDPFDRPNSRPPDYWFHDPAIRNAVYVNVEIPEQDIQNINVHALEHYLSHPSVHVPILRILCRTRLVISDDDYNAALAEWQKGRLLNRDFNNAKAKLNGILKSGGGRGEKLIRMLVDLRSLVQNANKPDGAP